MKESQPLWIWEILTEIVRLIALKSDAQSGADILVCPKAASAGHSCPAKQISMDRKS